MSDQRNIWVLGPQYHEPTLGEVFPTLELPDGPIAVVTAGWQEREGEDEELDAFVAGRSLDLELYKRVDRAFSVDGELREAHRATQRKLHEVEEHYELRLSYVLESVRRLLRAKGDEELLRPEQDHAITQLRDLDAWHLGRVLELRGEFEERWKPWERDALAREREELGKILAESAALLIAGGHVAVLLNRMRILGIRELASKLSLIAWSAGAMVLTGRVVLFHDHPPQGGGNAGVLEEGLGICSRLVALPDGRKRLDLDDPYRVASFARRFAPDPCVVLGDRDLIHFNGESWSAIGKGVLTLGLEGDVVTVSSW